MKVAGLQAQGSRFSTDCVKNSISFSFSLLPFTHLFQHSMLRPYYSLLAFVLLLCSFHLSAQQAQPVRFSFGNVQLPANFEQAGLMKPHAEEIFGKYYVRLIQCERIPTDAEKQIFEADGVQFIAYVHHGAYLALFPQQFDLRRLSRLHVRTIVPVEPQWKMAKSLREQPYGSWAVHGDRLDINLQLYPHISIAEGADLCRRNGMEVLRKGTQNGYLKVRVHLDELEKTAALSFVRYLELSPEPGRPEDTKGRSLHRSNLLDSEHAAGAKYNGEGVSVLVRDDGQLGPHIDFQGRLTNIAKVPPTAGTHGDGVGGIMAGAGNLDPSQKGMAAGATIYATDYEPEYQDTTLWLHQNRNVTVTNSSYSNGCNTGYTVAAQTVDKQIFENPTLMHVFSAGNSNSNDCGYGAGNQWGNITGGHKMAKNAIATANLIANARLDTTSSRGPAHDGRLKPDIAANGTDQGSTAPENNYQVFGGTSGAAPGIAGCLAQLTHAYKAQNGGQQPASALLKAALLNTANDLGNVGPDFRFGWGHVNTFRALRLLELKRWQKGSIGQGEEKTHNIQIPANTRLAKVMIYWADPPAEPGADRALVNDLDLTAGNATTSYLPWRLDPTPSPTLLNAPAGKGRDSLNNMEQVAIENPAAGAYTVRVKGTEVPFGPQEYYVVWEFLNDQIKMVYPNGGEHIAPGDTVRVHWDAYGLPTTNFNIRLLSDNGSFTALTSQTGVRRMYDWVLPATIKHGQYRLLIIRGTQRDTSDQPFLIAPATKSVAVEKVCPDSIVIGWQSINDTIQYAGYLLGEKYMELKGVSDTNFISFPITNPQLPKWYAASPMMKGLTGKRSLAEYWPGGLKNCPQPEDIALRQLLSPPGGVIVLCEPGAQSIQVKVRNEGKNTLTNAYAHYQINSEPTVDELLPDLAPGDSLDYTFQKTIPITGNGSMNLRIWTDYPGDDYLYNDTIQLPVPIVAGSQKGAFIEEIKDVALPDGWIIQNPDGNDTWQPVDSIRGKDGLFGKSFLIDCYNYRNRGQEDLLYAIPIDLKGVNKPTLVFDVAHAQFNADYAEQLRVELLTDCNVNAKPIVIWEKTDPELATVSNSTAYFEPGGKNDWRTEGVDLSPYKGQSVIIRFVSTNDYGNALYLDNVGVADAVPPSAEFTVSADTICRLDTVIYTVKAPRADVNYAWNFGLGAQPYNSSTDAGPHKIRYTTPGIRSIRLLISSPFGNDTVIQRVVVANAPTANFTANANLLSVKFQAAPTNNATSYRWNFGDDSTSVDPAPTHVYAKDGTYTVTLTARNGCSTTVKTLVLKVTSVGVQDFDNVGSVQIMPNPTAGDFFVQIESRVRDNGYCKLLDAQGRLIKSLPIQLTPGKQTIPFSGLQLPKGLYQVQIQVSGAQHTSSISIQ